MTDEPEETALEAVLRHLGSDDLPHIIPPARSAGIEGTGSGQQLDQEESRLIDIPRAQVETEVERALDDRIQRYQRLVCISTSIDAQTLKHFCSVKALPNSQVSLSPMCIAPHLFVLRRMQSDFCDVLRCEDCWRSSWAK